MDGAVKKGIAFRPEDYKQAAEEHIVIAQDLWDAEAYVLGIYVAGLAVEAMFRGYYAMQSREFDARHDLSEWARKSGFLNLVPDKEYEKYSVALSSLVLYWSNSHRYRSVDSLRKYYKRLGRDRTIKGDAVKAIAKRTLNAALDLITLGKELWKLSSRN